MIGKHNFFAFSKHELGDTRTPFKNMQSLIVERSAESSSNIITIAAHCDRFLYNMMRKIVGTLVEVGLGRITQEEFRAVLEAAEYSRKVVTAPARGLCLDEVFY